MEKLENILPGSVVQGIEAEPVTIIKTSWRGNSLLEIDYKNSKGRSENRFLLRSDEPDLTVVSNNQESSPERARLLLETLRIQMAKSTDPFLAVETSSIQPLPHQISAVYQEMLPRIPLRFLLADDPGAGKTVMTGLLVKELMVREDMKRCLIVCPGGLTEQWKDELEEKFSLRFTVLTSALLKEEQVFESHPFSIVSMDILARNEKYKKKLAGTEWDLIVVDEAHKLSATIWGNEIKYSKRYLLGQLLSEITKNFLLLTATPHNGKSEEFELFMSLLDKDRFEGAQRHRGKDIDVSDLMRRMVKESLLKFDGTPLFPNRYAYTAEYSLSSSEQQLYEAVTDYVRNEFNRAEKLEGSKKTAVGFALTILQRRLASSPEAIYQSLKRRKEKLEKQLRTGEITSKGAFQYSDDLSDEYAASAIEEIEDESFETASLTREELEAEIETLSRLTEMAETLRQSGVDRKWEELSSLIQSEEGMINPETYEREKLIIFTEHKDTLNYLRDRLTTLLGNQDSVLTISGATSRRDRKLIADIFKNDPEASILLATDAAGEGINLQNAHLMVNYDLPWNPNRLEQRFGRIHRIGQQHDCYLWNLCSGDTREGKVYTRLLQKLDTEKGALQGKVFDIIGKLTFENRSLKDLLLEAIRSDKEESLLKTIDKEMNPDHLKSLMHEEALTEELMDTGTVFQIKEEMERAEAHKLQPHFIESYFLELLDYFGGKAIPKGNGVYELTSVPFRESLPSRYRSVFFEPGKETEGELIAPGHPLLEQMMNKFLSIHLKDLNQNLVLTDPQAVKEKKLYVFETKITDHTKKPVSEQIFFILEEDGQFKDGGYAPYLDYQSPKNRSASLSSSTSINHIEKAEAYLKNRVLEEEKRQIEKSREPVMKKAKLAVRKRLTQEIQYWDNQYSQLITEDPANAKKAAKRADELHERLLKRMERFDQEASLNIEKPELLAVVSVLPGQKSKDNPDAESRKRVEQLAMKAVFEIEKSEGNLARDVSLENVGYDIESRTGRGNLRFIEVKGRVKGSKTVTITKNEILTALNKPDDYILALVEVDGNKTRTVYLKEPFISQPDFSIASINYNIKDLIEQAKEYKKYGE